MTEICIVWVPGVPLTPLILAFISRLNHAKRVVVATDFAAQFVLHLRSMLANIGELAGCCGRHSKLQSRES